MEKQNAIFWKPPVMLKAHQEGAFTFLEQLLCAKQCSVLSPMLASPRLPTRLPGSHHHRSYFTGDQQTESGEVSPPRSKRLNQDSNPGLGNSSTCFPELLQQSPPGVWPSHEASAAPRGAGQASVAPGGYGEGGLSSCLVPSRSWGVMVKLHSS